MEWFREMIESGQIVLIMLIFVAAEAIGCVLYWRVTGRGIAPLPLLLNLGAGGSLMAALWVSLSGAPWQWLMACLLSSLICHCADIAHRWRTHAPQAGTSS